MAMRTWLTEGLDPVQAYALLAGGVGPRPIALASTCDPEGRRNLAPFSFFNAFGSRPPMVAFAPGRTRDGGLKHTSRNTVATGECVLAAVSWAMAQQMNVTSAEYPDGVDEFAKSGFTPLPAGVVRPALVAESPFQMECRLEREVDLGSGPGSGLLLICRVLAFHVREDVWTEGGLDPDRLDLVGRHGGAYYVRSSGPALFRLPRAVGQPMGYDALPQALRRSAILTGNDLGQLASAEAPPDPAGIRPRSQDPGDAPGLERAVQRALAAGDRDEAWRLAALRVRMDDA